MITRMFAFFGHDLSREVDSLRTQLEEEQINVGSLTVDRDDLKTELADARSAYSFVTTQFDDMTAWKDRESRRATDLQQQLFDATATIEELTGTLAITKQHNRELLVSIGEIQARLSDADLYEQLTLLNSPTAAVASGVAGPESESAAGDAKPELISDSTPEGVFRVLGIFFIDRRYWLLSRDEGRRTSRITAAMHDRGFVERLHKREISFSDGDSLRVRLNTRTWRRPDGSLFTQYAITEVIEILAPPEQLTLEPVASAAAKGASS